MNTLLDTAGALIYLFVSIVTFPLLLIVHFFIGCLVAFKQVRAYNRSFIRSIKRGRYKFPRFSHLSFGK